MARVLEHSLPAPIIAHKLAAESKIVSVAFSFFASFQVFQKLTHGKFYFMILLVTITLENFPYVHDYENLAVYGGSCWPLTYRFPMLDVLS